MNLLDIKEVPRSGTQTTLAFTVVFSFLLVIILWTFWPPPGDPAQINTLMTTLVSVLATAAVAIVSFYFGSSEGSKGKDQTIGDIAKQQTSTPQNGTGSGGTVIVPPPSTVIMEAGDDIEGDPIPRPRT